MALRSYMKGLLSRSSDIEIVNDNSFSRIHSLDSESSTEFTASTETVLASPTSSFHNREDLDFDCPRTPVLTPRGARGNIISGERFLRNSSLLVSPGRGRGAAGDDHHPFRTNLLVAPEDVRSPRHNNNGGLFNPSPRRLRRRFRSPPPDHHSNPVSPTARTSQADEHEGEGSSTHIRRRGNRRKSLF